MTAHPLDDFSSSRIFRRCGQLGIPRESVLESPYGRVRGWAANAHKIQYRDGVRGTVGWGEDARTIGPNDTLPHGRAELEALLGL